MGEISCDLCNESGRASEGTFMKKMSSGGLVQLCNRCWDQVSRARCGLCGTPNIPQEYEKQNTITENEEDGRTAPVCNECRNVLDWDH